MRLINVHTLQLDEFFGSQIPEYQYAILSHTWEEEEVTFQEMQSLTDKPVVRNKRGFSKIELTCDQAKKDGLDWAWVDTCCIDKSSSAELSEAINSMYTWYAKSTACYAYLVDAEANHDPEVQGLNFRGSRWFTRGWTLQELIAPSTVNFFGKSWEFLGTRDTLQADIRAVTGIPWNVLLISSPLEKFSVAQKMSWASKRQTTREEDVAYCMLGLLGIHMPLLYGEGSKAFLRLQEEIIKQIDDQSLFAWAVDSKDPRAWSIGGLLANSPADFADCSTIGSLTDEVGEPSVLTKKGLYIHAPILPLAFPDTSRLHSYGTGNAYTRRGMHPQLFQLVLNCRSLDSFSSPVTIWIYRTDEWSIKDIDRRVFARVMAPGIRQYWGERNADEFTELTELTEDFKRIYLTMKTQPDQPFIGGGIHLHGIPLLFRHPLYDS
ncbi:HET-domain-containing protein, partial [Cladorrhinum sp. PSN332]